MLRIQHIDFHAKSSYVFVGRTVKEKIKRMEEQNRDPLLVKISECPMVSA